jgi:hypothetical protein
LKNPKSGARLRYACFAQRLAVAARVGLRNRGAVRGEFRARPAPSRSRKGAGPSDNERPCPDGAWQLPSLAGAFPPGGVL